MNSCILMAEIIKEPELRYTPDNQTQIAEMLVQFPGTGTNDPPATLKVIGWGNLAQEIHQQYHLGDRVILEGRLSMNTFERKPEGFKEKRAELTVQRIYSLNAEMSDRVNVAPMPTPTVSPAIPSNVVPLGSRSRAMNSTEPGTPRSTTTPEFDTTRSPQFESVDPDEPENPDYDPIPF